MSKARSLLLAAISASLFVACGDDSAPPVDSSSSPTMMASQISAHTNVSARLNQSPQYIQYEIRFMTRMIDHHMLAIDMAELCVERAIHEELGALCSEMATAQMLEVETMRRWLLDWYGIRYQPRLSMQHLREMAELRALGRAEFEVEFIETMIRHHASAVRQGMRCELRASHPELLAMCAEMIDEQSAEIELMERWLCSWYAEC